MGERPNDPAPYPTRDRPNDSERVPAGTSGTAGCRHRADHQWWSNPSGFPLLVHPSMTPLVTQKG